MLFKLIVCIAFLHSIKCVENLPSDLKIVGGEDANIADHPWQVALVDPPHFSCGGSIISEKWVVTAAHCGFAYTHIRAGSNDSFSGGVLIKKERVYIHPDFDPSTGNLQHDIALIYLESPIDTNVFTPVTLPSPDEELPVGTPFNITGWGDLTEYESSEPLLQQVTIPVLYQDICKSIYEPILFPNVTNDMVCGGFLGTGGKGPCYGDSGGPAVSDGKLIGIVSWGYGCARPGYPALFTRVSSYLDWISNHTSITNF